MPAFDIKALPPTISPVFDAGNRCTAARVNLALDATLPSGMLEYLCREKKPGEDAPGAFRMPLLIEADNPQWWAQTLARKQFSSPIYLLLSDKCLADPEAQAALAELDGRAVTLMTRDLASENKFVRGIGIDVANGLNGWDLLQLRKFKGTTLAIGVGSDSVHQQCLQAGFRWFEGNWLLNPESGHESRTVTSRSTLLNLLSLVVNDADSCQIEALFKQDPNLSYQLLRLVNSVGFSLPQKINSFNHAITILGQRQLQRWLQLLLFAGHYADGTTGALLGFAARRAALMEGLAEARGGRQEEKDRAFMVGLFSLLDVLFNAPIADLVMPINLTEEIARALISHEGILGSMLELAIATENKPDDVMAQTLAELAIAPDIFVQAQLNAMSWAMRICREI